MMHMNAFIPLVFGVIAILLCSSMSSFMVKASVISCPPNNLQETSPNLRQLCYTIEQLLIDSAASAQDNNNYPARLVDERNTNLNAKRQDVDHVFLRFGRRFGL